MMMMLEIDTFQLPTPACLPTAALGY